MSNKTKKAPIKSASSPKKAEAVKLEAKKEQGTAPGQCDRPQKPNRQTGHCE